MFYGGEKMKKGKSELNYLVEVYPFNNSKIEVELADNNRKNQPMEVPTLRTHFTQCQHD